MIIGNSKKNLPNVIALGDLKPCGFQSLPIRKTMPRHKLKIIHQNAQYLGNKTELFAAFLHSTTPDILAVSEHGLKEDEIPQCMLEGYTVA
jgi:hypothetical protein